MCETCYGQQWIIGLDGKLKRCPTCSTPRQIDWIEREAQLHALRLGMVDEEAHDTSNAGQSDESIDGAGDAGAAKHDAGAAHWQEWARTLAP